MLELPQPKIGRGRQPIRAEKILEKFQYLGVFRWALWINYGIVVVEKQARAERPKESKNGQDSKE